MKKSLFKVMVVSSICIASSFSIVNWATAAPTSDSLPVPNYVNGANLNYSSGLNINKTAGTLNSTVQNQAVSAANSSTKLNVEVGGVSNNVADLRYNTFNIGEGKTVNFNFGASNQAALNRVTQAGNSYASQILGNITQAGADGAVFVINPNGILFGKNSSVNVGAFTASTLKDSSNTLKAPSGRRITFSRGSLTPAGIYFENGASVTTKNGANFASNGIIDKGANITAGNNNVQLVTGDGVTFRFNTNYQSTPVIESEIIAAKVLSNEVKYPNGVVDSNHNISVEGGNISGHNVTVISKINKPLTSPFDELVNLDGVITASVIAGNNGGEIKIIAQNIDPSGKTNAGFAGVKINSNLTAGAGSSTYQGNIIINSDKLTMGTNGRITTDNLNLVPTTTNKHILLG